MLPRSLFGYVYMSQPNLTVCPECGVRFGHWPWCKTYRTPTFATDRAAVVSQEATPDA